MSGVDVVIVFVSLSALRICILSSLIKVGGGFDTFLLTIDIMFTKRGVVTEHPNKLSFEIYTAQLHST